MMALDGVMTVLQGRYESAMKALDWRYGGARWRYEGFIQVPSKRYTDAIRMIRWRWMALWEGYTGAMKALDGVMRVLYGRYDCARWRYVGAIRAL